MTAVGWGKSSRAMPRFSWPTVLCRACLKRGHGVRAALQDAVRAADPAALDQRLWSAIGQSRSQPRLPKHRSMPLGQRDDRLETSLLFLAVVPGDVGKAMDQERILQPPSQRGEILLGNVALAESREHRDDLLRPQRLEIASQRGVAHRLCHREIASEALAQPALGEEGVT